MSKLSSGNIKIKMSKFTEYRSVSESITKHIHYLGSEGTEKGRTKQS